MRQLLPLLLAGIFGVACDEPAKRAATPTSNDAPESAPAHTTPPPTVDWQNMDGKQRGEHMKKVVLPSMKQLFASYDAEEFAEVKCQLCHGEDAKARKFEMPNPDLPALNPADSFAAHRKESPEMLDFMAKKIVPTMAKNLGMQPYDPQTQEGFGCFACHTREE